MSRVKYNVGDRFGSLVILERLGVVSGSVRVLCRCDCGNAKEAQLNNLVSGGVKHCADRTRHPGHNHKGDAVSYHGAHVRVARLRGKASEHRCARCQGPAEQWVYSLGDPGQRQDATGKEAGRPYSSNPDHYTAMCRPCHLRHDRAHRRVAGPHRPGIVSLVHHAIWLRRHRSPVGAGAAGL